MNSNDSDERENGTGDHKKRKMTCNQALPPNPIKEAVSSQGLSEASSTLAGQESSSGSPRTALDHPHEAQSRSLRLLDFINGKLTLPSASHFSGAHNCVFNGGTFNNILGNYIAVAESSDADSRTRSSNGIIKDFPIISVEDVSIERQIYKGRGYRLHAAKMSGKIVAMKVYEGTRARERCLEVARFNRKVIHPNIPQMIGVSPLKSELFYLVFDGEYEGAVHDILGQALKKDLKQILTLGLHTVVGLSSGLDYLQDLKYPLGSVGLDHFVILSCKGRPVISFDLDDQSQINQSDHQPDISNTTSVEDIFHKLCERTFDSACKAHYKSKQIQRANADEFDINFNDLPKNRFEELELSSLVPSLPTSGRPSPQILPRKLLSSGRRQELVWKSQNAEAVSLNDISQQFQNFLNAHLLSLEPAFNYYRGQCMARTVHRCPGYNRMEITLTANITHSAIVSHSSPNLHEICPVCKEVVKDTDVFNCICGNDDNESIPTIRCMGCSEWHHRPCIISLDVESLTFVCEKCQSLNKQNVDQAGPSEHWNKGKWKKAEALEMLVIERKHLLGEEHPDTLTSMANLASTYLSQDKWKEAEALGVVVMEKRKHLLGEEHPDTLTSMANLVSTYLSQDKWKEAEALGVVVMEKREHLLGEEHPDTLTSMADLVSTYISQDKWKEAEALGVVVMEKRKHLLGEEHSDTLTSIADLAYTYFSQDKWKEAEALGVVVMEKRRHVLGEVHPDTLESKENLASIYRDLGRWKEAEALGIEVMCYPIT